jgi:hypothetical protein
MLRGWWLHVGTVPEHPACATCGIHRRILRRTPAGDHVCPRCDPEWEHNPRPIGDPW